MSEWNELETAEMEGDVAKEADTSMEQEGAEHEASEGQMRDASEEAEQPGAEPADWSREEPGEASEGWDSGEEPGKASEGWNSEEQPAGDSAERNHGSGAQEMQGPEATEGAEQNGQSPEEGEEAVSRPDSLAFIESLLDERVVRAIREMGFEKLTPIQEMAIPYLLDGDDIIGQAQTGTGKTAAFGIPALQKIDPDLKKLQTVILCPTRELAMQAAEEIRKIAKYLHGIKVLPVYGGQDIMRQINGLKGVQIIVGTPGRVMDHMRRGTVKLDDVNMVVLDEADEMLDMGFREDMELILGQIPNAHQTALFSATMPKPILDIANKFQKDARLVKVAAKELTIPLVSQRYYRVKKQDKDAACVRLLEYYQPKLCLIFCNTKIKVDELAEVVKKAGFQVEGLHGDMSQHQRDVAMGRFRNGTTNILIATDVAARGIDVDNVEIVINYDLPQDTEYYVHRIGRTGRAGKTGRSFTFASNKELFRIRQIERFCHTTIEERKLPGAAKVLKAKADIYLNRAWEVHESEDMELMKDFLQRKLDEEECDALELAAAMLKYQIGDLGKEIEEDDNVGGGRGDRRSRSDRDSRRRRDRDGDGEGRRRRDRDEDREGRRRRDRGGDGEGRRRRDHDGDHDGRRGRDEDRSSRRRRDEEQIERRVSQELEGSFWEKEERQDSQKGRDSERFWEREERNGEERGRRGEERGRNREERRSSARDWEREERNGEERGRNREERRSSARDWEREERNGGERDRRGEERGRNREERRSSARDWEREERNGGERGRRGEERGRNREERRSSARDWEREESSRNREERRSSARDWEREERNGGERGRRGEERGRNREERRSSARDWEREERGRNREERRSSARDWEREDKRSSRKKDEHRDSGDSRKKRDREEGRKKEERGGRLSKVRDVRLDGGERGLAFSFPKKKRK